MAKCRAETASGEPCKMQALKGDHYCFTHSPANGGARAMARKLGGDNRHTPHAANAEAVNKQPRTIQEIFSILDYALAETLVMDNCIQRGRLLVSIAAAYIDALKVGELEARLLAIESALRMRNKS